jgi:hypothetical protein
MFQHKNVWNIYGASYNTLHSEAKRLEYGKFEGGFVNLQRRNYLLK